MNSPLHSGGVTAVAALVSDFDDEDSAAPFVASPEPTTVQEEAAHLEQVALHLERGTAGRQVWNVVTTSGSYVLSLGHDDDVNPKRACQRWLDDHPRYVAEGCTVQEGRVLTESERALLTLAKTLRASAVRLHRLAGLATPSGAAT